MWCEEVKLKKGTVYRYYERYRCPYTNKLKRVCITLNSNSKQAQKTALYKLQAEIEAATKPKDSDLSLKDAFADYTASKSKFMKPSTMVNNRYTSNAILSVFPDGILLSNITIAIAQHAFDAFQAKYSYGYSKSALALFRSVLKYSRRLGYIANVSFADDIELTKVKKDVQAVIRDREKYLSRTELNEFLAALAQINKHISMICEFQALTGLRIGELLALRLCDYDKSKNEIDVNATLCGSGSMKNAKRIAPKNVYSIRRVSLDDRATNIINYFITAKKARELWKSKFSTNDYIFVTDGGKPYDTHYINRTIKKVDFHKHITTHTFRHTHISLLAEADVPLKAIMERVGHNEPRTTLSVYTHVTDEMKKEVNAAIAGIGKTLKR